MPVTAKLSRKFYERLGDDIANELVDWFNQVDATYSTELRELNDRNFERFDARLDQRLAELRGELRSEVADTRSTLIKWMFVFWTGTAVTNIGTTIAPVMLLG